MGWFRKKPEELTEVQRKEKEFGKQCDCGHYRADHPNSNKRGLTTFTYGSLAEEHYYYGRLTNEKKQDGDACLLCDCQKYNRKKK